MENATERFIQELRKLLDIYSEETGTDIYTINIQKKLYSPYRIAQS